jgi:Na+/H+-dicarboxylate symporter
VIPLIVASLVVAVAATGARTVGRLGTRAFVVFVVLLTAVAAMTALLAPLLFARLTVDPVAARSIRDAASAVARPDLPTFAGWVVSLVPTNPFRAAADGAMLPLIVFTLAFSLALGRLADDSRAPVVGFFRGVAGAMTIVVQWVLAAAPLGVFVLALALATRLGSGVVGAVGFYLAAHSLLLLLATLFVYGVVAVAGRVSLGRFARAALPAQVVAVTTRSSMAALPAMLTSAEEALALPRATTSFALPLAVSVFRLNQAVSWLAMALFAAKLYGVTLGVPEIATLAVTSVLMSFSVPGIPSGSLFVVAPFFAGVGIPPESVGVLIAVDLVPDVFKTLLNVTGHLGAVTMLGREAAASVVTPLPAVSFPGTSRSRMD